LQVKLTFEPEFDTLYREFLINHPDLLDIEGISPRKIDVGQMSHDYFTEKLSDVSVDENANANEEKSANNYQAEVTKGALKLEGYYLLWRYAKKRFNVDYANKLIKSIWLGDLYFHDASGHGIQIPYCWAYSTDKLMLEGRPYGQLHSLPPKRADSFMAQVIECTMDLSQEFAGAIAPSDMIVNYSYYAKKEGLTDKQIINGLQKFVHVMNNKFRVSGQSLKYDTPILVNNEWVKIGDFVSSQGGEGLVNGDYETISFNPKTGKVSKNKIYAVTTHKRTEDLVEITLSTGQKITVTANHSLFTLDEDGDIVVSAPEDNPNNIIVPINFANDNNLTVDISGFSNVLKKVDKNTRLYNMINLDDKMMYLLGYYLGNGTCDGSTLGLSIHNTKLEDYFVNTYPEFNPSNNGEGTVKLNVGKQFCEWVRYTFGGTAHTKHIPVEYSLKSNSLQLVAGYLDADGCTDGKTISASSVSEQLINDVQFTLQAHGLLSNTSNNMNNANNFLNKPFMIYNLYIPNNYAYKIPCKIKGVVHQDCVTVPYYDLTNIKKMCQRVFKQSKYNWKANIVRYDKIDELLEDFDDIINVNIDAVSKENYHVLSSLFGLPNVIANSRTAKELYGWEKGYNLNTGVNIDIFIEKAKERQKIVKRMKRKVNALNSVIPIKVKEIKRLSDKDEYVYDVSVENDENFIAGNGIMAHNSPFVNISLFDRHNLEKVFSNTVFPDGSQPDFDYIIRIQKLFGEWFAKGDPVTQLPYRFPIVTLNLHVNEQREIEDKDFLDWAAAANIEKGCFNIYINEGNKIATCCRLSNEFTQARADSFGNGGLNVGSHRVVTINLPRIAMLAERDKLNFFYRLESKLNEARDLLLVHREEILERRIKSGFLKFFNPLKWFKLDMMFSTIGIIGVYEMCHYMGLPIETEEGQQFAEEVLKHIEQYAQRASKETGYSFNVEEIPGESTAPALAKKDAIMYGNTIPMYSNQYLPLTADVDAITRIKLTGKFMRYLSGGGILHLNVQEKIAEPVKMRRLIELAVKEGVEHFAINYGFGICENGHTSPVGTGKTCPLCQGEIVDWFTRVIGYFTKTSSWNEVRREYEYPKRKFN
jgi:anaerobic ribonucleoside-triphosphate reductase